MKTWNDVWQYLCEGYKGYDLAQFYVSNPSAVAKAFWNGVLTALEVAGKITKEDGMNIWNEITGGKG